MQTPLVFRAILGLLMDLAIPAALGAFVLAGMRLRSEGGMNFEASGGFLKWLFWGCLLISLPGVSLWLSNEGVPGASQLTIAGATGAPYTQGVDRVANDFVNNFLVAHVVPVVAASLVFKAILDLSQGYSPLASIIAALFLLGVQGIYNLATGNPASERGVHFSMPWPLRNRFVHLNLEPDFEDWCQWAVRAELRPEIVAFLRFKPALLHDANATSDVNAWPTPRSWEMASNVLTGFGRRQISGFFAGATEIEAQLLEGTVGPAATMELVAFLRLFRDLPSIDEILLNPDSAPLPGELSAQIAIATALGRVLSDHSIAKGMQYLDRMPTEMRVLAIRDASARNRGITHTPEFVRFGVEHAEVLQ
jgi:hypothetical protein